MRLFVLAIVLAVLTSLAATLPGHADNVNQELIADLEEWLAGRWLCEYSPHAEG